MVCEVMNETIGCKKRCMKWTAARRDFKRRLLCNSPVIDCNLPALNGDIANSQMGWTLIRSACVGMHGGGWVGGSFGGMEAESGVRIARWGERGARTVECVGGGNPHGGDWRWCAWRLIWHRSPSRIRDDAGQTGCRVLDLQCGRDGGRACGGRASE